MELTEQLFIISTWKTKHAYYTYWKASKYFWVVFANFYLTLVMQSFMGFLDFANYYYVSCKIMKAVKIEFDTSYHSWGSSPKLASDSLLLVGIKPSPTVVSPPLLM